MNNVSLIGRLVFDPELKYVNDDRAVCTFCLAVSRNYRNKDGVIPTDFINIDIWGRRAETLCQYASKGSLIAVEGSLRIDKYVNKDGQNRTKAIINAYNFHFLGHKHRSSDHRKVFEDKDIFKDVINDEEVFEGRQILGRVLLPGPHQPAHLAVVPPVRRLGGPGREHVALHEPGAVDRHRLLGPLLRFDDEDCPAAG